MTAILNTLLEITVYSGVIFGAIWIFRLLLKKHVSPAMLYIVWFLLVARLLVPMTVPSGISFFVIPSGQIKETQTQNVGLSAPASLDGTAVTNTGASMADTLPPAENTQPQTLQNTAAETTAVTSNTALPKITWQIALVMLWLAGVAAMLIQTAVSYVRLKNRLKNASLIPLGWQKIAEELEAELGLRRGIRAVMIAGFPSPALSAGLKPVVVLPEELLSQNDETVRFALLHELTHIRRKDHIVIILLLLLRALYWFNPVVWLTVKQMRLDMESACDSRLTRPMSNADKKQYAGIMLSMYAKQQVRFALGMALGQTKKTAERRLRGVFMRGRSSRKAKLTAMLLAAILLFTCFTTACQPVTGTPGSDPKKYTGWIPQPPSSYKTSEHWNETVQNENANIVIDTDVFVPDVNKYPVTRLERAAFTQQRVDELVNYFAKGKNLYLPRPTTKAEYQQRIDEAKRGQEMEPGKYVVTQDSLESVQLLEEAQAAAPEYAPLIITDTTLTYRKDETGKEITEHGKNYLRVMIGDGDADDGSICINNGTDDSSTSFLYSKYPFLPLFDAITESMYQYDVIGRGLTEAAAEYVGAGELFGKVEVTPEEAIEQSDKVISDLGINGLMLVNAEKYVVLHAPEKGGYMVEYARQSGGIPVSWFDFYSSNSEDPQYTMPFAEEVLTAYISKDGLACLQWRGCANALETVSENAKLLPFGEIKQALKDTITYQCLFNGGRDQDYTITVTSVELRMGYIEVKGNPNQALMVPVWVFNAEDSSTFQGKPQLLNKITYMLNATDGCVIGIRSLELFLGL